MKICTKCKASKTEDEFAWKNKAKQIKFTICKPCKNEVNKRWYESNKEKHVARVTERNRERRLQALQWKYDYLLKKKCCVDGCTNNNPLGLELDHLDRNNKLKSVSDMIRLGYSLENIKAEAEKCRVICAYHHAIWTAEQMNHTMWRNNAYIETETIHTPIG